MTVKQTKSFIRLALLEILDIIKITQDVDEKIRLQKVADLLKSTLE